MPSVLSRLGVMLPAACLLIGPACPAAGAPKPPPKKKPPVRKSVPRRPARKPAVPIRGADWGGDSLKAAVDHRTGVTFGPPGCPVAVIGPNVWDLAEKKIKARITGGYEARGLRALSSDGRWFAGCDKTPNQTETVVRVWDTATGKPVLQVPARKEVYVDLLAFGEGPRLLVGGRHSNRMEHWDLEAGHMVATVPVPDRRVEPEHITLTQDGRYFACVGHDKLTVAESATGNPVVVLDAPGPPRVDLLPPHPNGGPARPAAPNIANIFVYSGVEALAFSPDGKELAAFTTYPYPRMLCWNTTGKLTVDEPVSMPHLVTSNWRLDWLPDRTGWLVNGYLFDRDSRRVILRFRTPFAAEVLPHLLDRDQVAGVFASDEAVLKTVRIPWTRIYASLKAMRANEPAFVSPLQPLSILVDITGARGDLLEAQRMLWGALWRRVARDGIGVSAEQPSFLRLRLFEQAGETLPIYERQSPFDFRGRDTGRRATEAKGTAVLELWAAGERAPLWRDYLRSSSSRSFREEITDATLRRSMLEFLTRQLNGIDMPYFVPRNPGLISLPVVVE